MPNVPGLDGVRAVSLLVVLAFHLGVPGFDGGFLGLPFFFALSGYLITQVILADSGASLRSRLGRFWSRRLRRLAPASMLAIVVIAILARFDVFRGDGLRGDLGAALGYVFNWRVASSGQSYADLFSGSPSPLLHFWSLAIEEQFYVVLPLGLLALAADRRRRFAAAVIGVLLGASVVAGLVTSSRDLVYYGTHIRAAEMLVGVLLALLLPIGTAVGSVVRRLSSIGSILALVAFGYFVNATGVGSDSVYDGRLVVTALLAAMVILDVVVGGLTARVLSWRPLVVVGRLSYGLYLFHWPVIVALDEERTGLDGWLLGVVRIAVTVAVTSLSYLILEQPVRTRRLLATPRKAGTGYFVSVAVGVTLIVTLSPTSVVVGAGVDAPSEIVDFGAVDPENQTTTTLAPRPVVAVVASPGPSVETLVADIESRGLDAVTVAPPSGCPLGATIGEVDGCPDGASLIAEALGIDPVLVVLVVAATERDLVGDRVENSLVGPTTTTTVPVAGDSSEPTGPDTTGPDTSGPDTTGPGTTGLESTNDKRRTDAEVAEGERLARELVSSLSSSLSSSVSTSPSTTPLLVIDEVGGDFLAGGLVDADLRSESVWTLTTPTSTMVGEKVSELVGLLASVDERIRVIVIGDSVSFGVAQAIDAEASDRYDVVWAGGRNCPLVDVDRVSWGGEMEFDMETCPTIDDWDRLWFEVDPDLVLAIASVPEQSDQRYEPDGEWFRVGDPEFVRVHDEGIARLVEITERQGARLVMFDSPRIEGGAFQGAMFASDERVDAWNEALIGYAELHPIIEILDWASLVIEAETNAGGPGSLREDGVHMTPEVLATITRERLLALLDPGASADAG